MAVTLLAPRLFNTFFEWELSTFFGYLLCVGILLWALGRWMSAETVSSSRKTSAAVLLGLLAVVSIVGWIDLSNFLAYENKGVLFRTRNFFGTLLVREFDTDNPDHYIIFKHGATTHGVQFASDDRRGQPTTYYTPYSGIGRTITFLHGQPQVPPVSKKSSLLQFASHEPRGNIRANGQSRQPRPENRRRRSRRRHTRKLRWARRFHLLLRNQPGGDRHRRKR